MYVRQVKLQKGNIMSHKKQHHPTTGLTTYRALVDLVCWSGSVSFSTWISLKMAGLLETSNVQLRCVIRFCVRKVCTSEKTSSVGGRIRSTPGVTVVWITETLMLKTSSEPGAKVGPLRMTMCVLLIPLSEKTD
jgi:hypothetical protein